MKTNMRYLGTAPVRVFSFMVINTTYAYIPGKKRAAIERRLDRLATKIASMDYAPKPSLFSRVMFFFMRMGHTFISRNERKNGRPDTYDYPHWQQQDWLKEVRPWKQA